MTSSLKTCLSIKSICLVSSPSRNCNARIVYNEKKNICASLYFAPFCTITKYCWDVLALCHFLIVWSKKGLKIDTKPLSRTSPKSLCVLKIDWRHLGLKATRIIKTPLARKMCLQRIFPSMHAWWSREL